LRFPSRAVLHVDGNRFELRDEAGERWLACRETASAEFMRTTQGKRFMLALDLACLVPKLLDEIRNLQEALHEIEETDDASV
jgi:hypothetical protein